VRSHRPPTLKIMLHFQCHEWVGQQALAAQFPDRCHPFPTVVSAQDKISPGDFTKARLAMDSYLQQLKTGRAPTVHVQAWYGLFLVLHLCFFWILILTVFVSILISFLLFFSRILVISSSSNEAMDPIHFKKAKLVLNGFIETNPRALKKPSALNKVYVFFLLFVFMYFIDLVIYLFMLFFFMEFIYYHFFYLFHLIL
jgi:hypothetical protein